MSHLTQAQKTTLKTAFLADGPTVTEINSGQYGVVATIWNQQASPNFTVWKTNVPIGDVGKAFNGSELAGLTTANQTRLQTIALYLADGVNASLASNRAFFDDIFSGAGGANTRTALLVLWKRLANRFEKALATGTGSDASPATLGAEGTLNAQEVEDVIVNG